MLVSEHNRNECKLTRDYTEGCQVLVKQVRSQYFSGLKSNPVEGVAIEHFNIFKPSTIPMAQFHYRLLHEIYQDNSPTAAAR